MFIPTADFVSFAIKVYNLELFIVIMEQPIIHEENDDSIADVIILKNNSGPGPS